MPEAPDGYAVKILKDSRNPVGDRLTTFELTYPRFVHAELMTHRLFCLAGDVELEFDLPAGQGKRHRRVYRMRLDEFYDKWSNGARRVGSKPKREADLSWVEPDAEYSAVVIASRLGFATASNINGLCRAGQIPARKEGRFWFIRGQDVIDWRRSAPATNRYDMTERLSRMRIRQLNEETGDIQTSNVVGAYYSGEKAVFEVVAGDFRVAGSNDHRIFTSNGWKPIAEINPGDLIACRKFGKRGEDRLDPLRLQKIDGVWRSVWQRKKRHQMVEIDPLCRRCRSRRGEDIHHVVPVYEDPSRATDPTNVTLLCEPCHTEVHRVQGWQGGTYLYGAFAEVEDVYMRGTEPTFDLEIAGDYPNFLANGVVVHNSRNSASSRAIPSKKLRQRIAETPVEPVWWGRNQRGMQAEGELEGEERDRVRELWHEAREVMLRYHERLEECGLHKQIANRIIEPWMFITVIVSATEYENWFYLRDSEFAQPEIAWVARRMREEREASRPQRLREGQWHLPLVETEDPTSPLYVQTYRGAVPGEERTLAKISTARCARVSYLTHDGERDFQKDIELHDRLAQNGHWSPFEHVAQALGSSERSGNFIGFRQYRKYFSTEHQGRRLP